MFCKDVLCKRVYNIIAKLINSAKCHAAGSALKSVKTMQFK